MNIPELGLPRIVIIGGGFAGIQFVNTIKTDHYQVVLIDKNNYHTFQPLMYQVATSGLEPDSVVYPLRKIIHHKKHTHFRMTEVKSINQEAKTIQTRIGDLTYDYLLVCVGAGNNFFGLENLEKGSFPMKDLKESLNLRSVILENFEKALNLKNKKEQNTWMRFVIVGAGATGVELAGALAELRSHVLPNDYPDLDVSQMKIDVIEASPRVLSAMSEHASNKSQRFLEKLGVEIHLETMVKDYDGTTIITNKGTIETKTVIWAAGVKTNSLQGLNIEQGSADRYLVDRYNRALGDESIFILGDAALMKTDSKPHGDPMLASVAAQQGKHLAKNFNRMKKKKDMKPFTYKDKGTMATVGRNLAVVDLSFIKFSGLFAWLTWMFVHLMLLVGFRNRLVVFINWAWSYIKFDRGTRLIIRGAKRRELKN